MDYLLVISNIALSIAIVLGGWFIKNFFPSYMEEKGKNLATKEDIADITEKTEEVQVEFKKQFELFSSDVAFKYDYFFKQYSELYCELYRIIIQSEYLRYIFKHYEENDLTFDEVPFIELVLTKDNTVSTLNKSGETITCLERTTVDTPWSLDNKKKLCDLIIDNGHLASQELLKFAMSYRFVYDHYSGTNQISVSKLKEIADEEELKLIRKMVCTIVKDYNYLRKMLNMTYDKKELAEGIINIESTLAKT